MSDTREEMLPTTSAAIGAPPRAHLAWAVPLAGIAFVALFAVLLASILPADLVATNAEGDEAPFAQVPADALAVEPRIGFTEVPRYRANGQVLFVTVSSPEVTLLDHFIGRSQGEVEQLSYEQKYPNQISPGDLRQQNLRMMREAKETAEYVALSKLGYPATLIPGSIVVDQLVCLEANEDQTECLDWAPSDDVLDRGDELLAIDGVRLEVIDDLTDVLATHEPGDVVTIELERPGTGTMTGEVELIASPSDPERTILGFVPFDNATIELPFEVSIDSDQIGGPSAGLAFALTLIDELTPGELTGNYKVGVTGSISVDGSVGAIGGLVAKTSAVKQMGAKVFLVPAGQSAEDIAAARAVAGDDLLVIPVATFDEALAVLASFGGNGLELGTPGANYVPAADDPNATTAPTSPSTSPGSTPDSTPGTTGGG